MTASHRRDVLTPHRAIDLVPPFADRWRREPRSVRVICPRLGLSFLIAEEIGGARCACLTSRRGSGAGGEIDPRGSDQNSRGRSASRPSACESWRRRRASAPEGVLASPSRSAGPVVSARPSFMATGRGRADRREGPHQVPDHRSAAMSGPVGLAAAARARPQRRARDRARSWGYVALRVTHA